jgi:hypothetical protein
VISWFLKFCFFKFGLYRYALSPHASTFAPNAAPTAGAASAADGGVPSRGGSSRSVAAGGGKTSEAELNSLVVGGCTT